MSITKSQLNKILKSRPLLIIDLDSNYNESFKDFDEIIGFCENQITQWHDFETKRRINNKFSGSWNELQNGISQCLEDSNSSFDDFIDQINFSFKTKQPKINYKLHLYESPFLKYLRDLDEDNDFYGTLSETSLFRVFDSTNEEFKFKFYFYKCLFQNEKFNNVIEDFKKTHKQFLDLKSEATKIESDINSQKDLIPNLESNFENKIEKIVKGHEQKLESLERAYQEKINISAASNLWTNQSKKYRNYALISFIVLLVLITGSVWGLWWLSENFLSVPELTNFNQIKLTVLSTIVVGLLVYAVTLVGKFTISNLHMRTDALERSALTDFYLSLIKENAIDEDTRKIIIQSLFARSDSGLIKGGGDPTIPSNLSDLINKSK